jgi:hypothetical protein
MHVGMNSRIITTVSLIVAASLIAATIAVTTFAGSAFAVRTITGGEQSQSAAQNAAGQGILNGINAAVGVQAEVGQVCVNALAQNTC